MSMHAAQAALAAILIAGSAAFSVAHAAEEVEITPRHSAETPAPPQDDEDGPSLADLLKDVHGEVGATIGTDGTRAAYGIATMPLGENGSLTIALSTGRYGESYYYNDGYCEQRDLGGRCLDGPGNFWRSRTMPVPPGR